MYVLSEVLSEPAAVVAPEGLRYGTPCAFAGCAGFFHPAAGPVGVVLCSPWGFEDLVMRKSWRLLAEAIAGSGSPCLRFDYPGTGDSLGTATSVASVDTWVAAINAGADFLRLNSGVRRFVFIGQSLGATLAATAARGRKDVAALQLIAPVAKGRSYVRELSATSAMVAGRIGMAPDLAPDEGVNVLGFGLSKPMVESLKALDLTRLDALDVADVTIFDSEDRKAGAEVAEHMRRLGLTTHVEGVAPYHLMVSDATEIQPLPVSPERVIAALARVCPVVSAPAPLPPRFPAALVDESWREEPIRFGRDGALFGVITRPLRERPGAPAVILLNRGLNPHIGWRRVSVDHARALASAGHTCLRIDIAGLGESRDEPGRSANLIYSDALWADISAAVDVFAARGHARIALAGVCSGAYAALGAAQLDPRVTDIIAFNPQRFIWNPAESMADVIRYGLRSMNDYVGDFKRGGILAKLVRSRRRIVPAMAFLARRKLRSAMSKVPLGVRSAMLRSSMAARVNHFFKTFVERGTRITMVFTHGDPSLDELRAYFGPEGRDMRYANVSVAVLEGLDHNFTSAIASKALLDHMMSAMSDGMPREPARMPARAPRTAPAVCPT